MKRYARLDDGSIVVRRVLRPYMGDPGIVGPKARWLQAGLLGAGLDAGAPPQYIVAPHMAPKDDLKKGGAELMVLAAIEDVPRHGYDIAREIDSRSTGVLRFHVASLYPMLYRLERRGWIAGRWVEKSGQRRRRYYKLTPEGRRMLAAQRHEWRTLIDALNRAGGLETA